MDDDLDANEEVIFFVFVLILIFFAEWREVEVTVCFSRTFSFRTNERSSQNKQTKQWIINKEDIVDIVRKVCHIVIYMITLFCLTSFFLFFFFLTKHFKKNLENSRSILTLKRRTMTRLKTPFGLIEFVKHV